jgi:hypothetical protein
VSNSLEADAKRQGEGWEGGKIYGHARGGDVYRPHKAFFYFVNNICILQIIMCNTLTCLEDNTE